MRSSSTIDDHRSGAGLLLTTALAPAAWGMTYIVTTELLPAGRPLLAGTVRALPAGLVLAAFTRHRPVGAWWAKALALGILNIGGFFALLFAAAYRLPGGVAATLGAIQPLVAAGLAAWLLRERLTLRIVLAGLLGFAGVALLVLRAGAHLDGIGLIAGLAGAASMASGVVLTKYWGRPVPLLAFTSWQLVAGGLVLLPAALAVEGLPDHLTGRNMLGFLWLATAGTAVAYSLWFRGIERIPVSQASLLGLMSPVVATAAGWAIAHQTLTVAQLGGAILVLSAVWLGQRTTHRPRHPMNASISAPVGMPPRAPTLVTESDAAATATGTAAIKSSPLASRAASTPLKVSPAPVVSRAVTVGADTC